MGLPTLAWSEDNFKCIAKLWGKFVLADDRTEDSRSYSVEFGGEVYSRESHPNKAELAYIAAGEETRSVSLVEETPMDESVLSAAMEVEGGEGSSNVHNDTQDPIIEKRAMEINATNDEGGACVEEMRHAAVEAGSQNGLEWMNGNANWASMEGGSPKNYMAR
ncbi:hypothetical protein PIB30_081934 [Stylosanthes scabra]|uniref:Uncharacterized protein n=1 Tax=Stylosanthes scabra TaxID=79078 RepID=A0ABU6XR54_9FABA|nr:hypothetical protein [Stylosanthes scabra]